MAEPLAPTEASDARIARAWEVLDGVPDPEVPAKGLLQVGELDYGLHGEGRI